MFIHPLSKFGKFSLKIGGEIICQSWLLLTPFFNLTIVQCNPTITKCRENKWEKTTNKSQTNTNKTINRPKVLLPKLTMQSHQCQLKRRKKRSKKIFVCWFVWVESVMRYLSPSQCLEHWYIFFLSSKCNSNAHGRFWMYLLFKILSICLKSVY